MKEIIPGIFQLQLPFKENSSRSINDYLIRDKNGYFIVDTGWETELTFKTLEKELKDAGIDFPDVKSIIVTHSHTDHYNMVPRLKKLYNPRFYMHRLEVQGIKDRYSDSDGFVAQMDRHLDLHGVPRERLIGPPPPMQELSELVMPDVTLEGGETLSIGDFQFQVIWTPGHAPGHIALYEPERKFIISGDHVLPTITSNYALHVQHMVNPEEQYLNSLRTLQKLEVKLALPGHEQPFTAFNTRVEQLLQSHQRKTQRVLKAMSDGKARNAFEVSLVISWSPVTQKCGWDQLVPFSKRQAVLDTVARLESLRFRNQVSRFSRDGVTHYQVT